MHIQAEIFKTLAAHYLAPSRLKNRLQRWMFSKILLHPVGYQTHLHLEHTTILVNFKHRFPNHLYKHINLVCCAESITPKVTPGQIIPELVYQKHKLEYMLSADTRRLAHYEG